jgi:polysaccharide biosynthesis protein PslG
MFVKLSARGAAGAAVLLVLTSVLTVAGTQARQPRSPGGYFRPVHFHHLHQRFGDLFGLGTYIAVRSPFLYRPALNRVKTTGIDWVREEFTAEKLHHGTNAPYEWWRWDRVVNAEKSRGMHILGLLDYNNTFDLGHDHAVMPHAHIKRLIADFVKYVTAIVTHYRNKIYAWQIWNEPDLGEFWKPYPRPKDYASLLTASYWAIRKANRWAQVIVGGPSGRDPNRMEFLRNVVKDGAKFDALSMQPYTDFPNQEFLNNIYALKKFHRPIWFTEMGWAGQAGCGACGTPSLQASRLATLYFASAVSGISKVFWYDLRDDGVRRNYEDHFGLLEWNLKAKPAYVAFDVALHYLNQATLVGVDHVYHGLTLYKLRKKNRTYFAAWNNSPFQVGGIYFRWRSKPVAEYNQTGNPVSFSRSHVLRLVLAPYSIGYMVPHGNRPPLWAPRGLNIPPGHTR